MPTVALLAPNHSKLYPRLLEEIQSLEQLHQDRESIDQSARAMIEV